MAGSDDKKALEYYLRYIASQNNKKLSGKCDRGEHANIFYRLVERFCIGRDSSSSILDSIYSFIGKETFGKDIRPYAFFDIDTLIAYNEYLNKVRLYSDDGVYIYRAIDLAMKDMLSSSRPIRENGYYDKRKPVVLRRDDEGRVKPLRRLPTKSFESRYDIADCQKMLNEYIKEKELDIQDHVQDNQFEENQSGIIEEQPELPRVGDEVPKTSHKSHREKAYIDGDFFIFRGKKYKKLISVILLVLQVTNCHYIF
jgi:hypothetical protein